VLVKDGLSPSTKVPGDHSLDGITLVAYDVQGLVAGEKSWSQSTTPAAGRQAGQGRELMLPGGTATPEVIA